MNSTMKKVLEAASIHLAQKSVEHVIPTVKSIWKGPKEILKRVEVLEKDMAQIKSDLQKGKTGT